jgi:hypothetical protein
MVKNLTESHKMHVAKSPLRNISLTLYISVTYNNIIKFRFEPVTSQKKSRYREYFKAINSPEFSKRTVTASTFPSEICHSILFGHSKRVTTDDSTPTK